MNGFKYKSLKATAGSSEMGNFNFGRIQISRTQDIGLKIEKIGGVCLVSDVN